MEPVRVVRGRIAPLDRANVDTDQIVPKQFLKRIERSGFGPFAFYDWRRRPDGSLDPDFVLNRPEYQGASILVTGPNFGSASSREHAPWALQDLGFKAIIAPSLADIFFNNCLKIGLLPVVLSGEDLSFLLSRAAADPSAEFTVDLEAQSVTGEGFHTTFSLDDSSRDRLLNGWDDIALTLKDEAAIAAYEAKRADFLPTVAAAD
jgi:3-isopropylmalate/(R)-2-methylmalate dehydratase small subunit